MSKVYKFEEKIEMNCSAQKIFDMLKVEKHDVTEVLSHKVPNIQARQGDWCTVGSTRKWDFIIGEKSTYLIDRLEALDEKNLKLTRSVIEGEMMCYCKTVLMHAQVIPKGYDDKSCVLKFVMEYEKINENAPEPKEFFNFGVGVFKELGNHLSSV
ncbi:MLP-like protein 43 [Silene latifolia]|uniref:MLP-like protein 43 n=1 Tax=Silene latifolia TaxID=37657 RepID=UPI003D76E638